MLRGHESNGVMSSKDSDRNVNLDLTLFTGAWKRLDFDLNLFEVVFNWRLVQNFALTFQLTNSIAEIRCQISVVLFRYNKKWSFDLFLCEIRLRLPETRKDRSRKQGFKGDVEGFLRCKHFNYYISGLKFWTFISSIKAIKWRSYFFWYFPLLFVVFTLNELY